MHLPASFCFLNSPFALYPLYLAWSRDAVNTELITNLQPKPKVDDDGL